MYSLFQWLLSVNVGLGKCCIDVGGGYCTHTVDGNNDGVSYVAGSSIDGRARLR